jgi:hypothetical protein
MLIDDRHVITHASDCLRAPHRVVPVDHFLDAILELGHHEHLRRNVNKIAKQQYDEKRHHRPTRQASNQELDERKIHLLYYVSRETLAFRTSVRSLETLNHRHNRADVLLRFWNVGNFISRLLNRPWTGVIGGQSKRPRSESLILIAKIRSAANDVLGCVVRVDPERFRRLRHELEHADSACR